MSVLVIIIRVNCLSSDEYRIITPLLSSSQNQLHRFTLLPGNRKYRPHILGCSRFSHAGGPSGYPAIGRASAPAFLHSKQPQSWGYTQPSAVKANNMSLLESDPLPCRTDPLDFLYRGQCRYRYSFMVSQSAQKLKSGIS